MIIYYKHPCIYICFSFIAGFLKNVQKFNLLYCQMSCLLRFLLLMLYTVRLLCAKLYQSHDDKQVFTGKF